MTRDAHTVPSLWAAQQRSRIGEATSTTNGVNGAFLDEAVGPGVASRATLMTAQFAMFLRGINVAGIRVPMADLRVSLEALGLQDVKTYLNTGNVTFASDRAPGALKKSIEKALTDRFAYEAFVLLYPFAALQPAIKSCPFTADDAHHRYAIFCGSQEVIDELMTHQDKLDPALEQIAAGTHVLYWRVPKGSTLDTPFSKIMSKPRYKSVTTNRNLNTVEKMVED